jgi:hypothetical protein
MPGRDASRAAQTSGWRGTRRHPVCRDGDTLYLQAHKVSGETVTGSGLRRKDSGGGDAHTAAGGEGRGWALPSGTPFPALWGPPHVSGFAP